MADTKHIFISYAREDGAAFAQQLDDALRAKGFPTWRDTRGIDPAKDFTAEIEVAIKAASYVVVCITPDTERDNSFVRREIQYALVVGKPVIVAKVDAKTPPPIHVINNTWIEFHKGWDGAFNQLDSILQKSTDGYHPPELSPKTADPFRAYLENLYERSVRFLDQAVIKLIDLTPEDTPDAVNAPSRRKDMLDLFFEAQGIGEEKPTEPKPFHTFAEAFEYYEGRVLLLGEPGAGKTITLFAFARDAVARRLNDINAPLPLLGLISSWDADKQTPLAEWLAEGYPELDTEEIKRTIDAGHALLLVDGLDELGSERPIDLKKPDGEKFDPRKRFIEQFPAKNQVLVTCRVQDYQEIGEKVGLRGAATLRPLNVEQMQLYLGEQPELWEAVQKDDGLREMLQTPLLLSFFAFAYKGMSDDDRYQLSDLSKSPGTLRNKIFEYYVRERFRHEERKRGHKLTYDYPTVYRVLGQAAIHVKSTWRENQIYWKDIQTELGAEPTEFIQQCQQLHLLVNLDRDTWRFMHLRLRDYFAVDALITSLGDTNAYVRFDAVAELGRIGDGRAVEPLVASLRDPVDGVRNSALVALERIGLPAVEPLITSLRDLGMDARWRVAAVLGWIGGNRAVEPLIASLRDPDERVHHYAVEALGWIGDGRAVEPLIASLQNPDWVVRRNAAAALGRIGDGRAVEPLIASLRDSVVFVRQNAVEALERIGQPAVDALIGNLWDSDVVVRPSIAEALKRIGTPKAKEAVRKWREKDDKK